MSDFELPAWDDLPDDQKLVVDALTKCADMMGSFSPDRVLLFAAYLTEGLVDTLANRVVAAMQMGVTEEIDPRVNVAGMALANCMHEYRESYELCFDSVALIQIKEAMIARMSGIEEMVQIGETGDIAALLAKLAELDVPGAE